MQRDIVCGMEIDEAKAEFKATYAGSSYYFCSEECLTAFRRLASVLSKDVLESISPTQFMEP